MATGSILVYAYILIYYTKNRGVENHGFLTNRKDYEHVLWIVFRSSGFKGRGSGFVNRGSWVIVSSPDLRLTIYER